MFFPRIASIGYGVLLVVFVACNAATRGRAWQRILSSWLPRATWDNVPTISLDLTQNICMGAENMLQAGVAPPNHVRQLLWLRLAGINGTGIREAADEIQDLLRNDKTSKADKKQIKKDLLRLHATQETMETFERVLRAYASFDKQVGYIQSLSFIVVPLLRVFEGQDNVEAKGFALFKYIMSTHRSVIINLDNKDEPLYGQEQVMKALKSINTWGTSNIRHRLAQIGMTDLKETWSAMFFERIMADKEIDEERRHEQVMIVIDNYLAFGFNYLVSMAAALIYEARQLIDHEEYRANCQFILNAVPTCVSSIIRALSVDRDLNHNVDNWLAHAHQIRVANRHWIARLFKREIHV